MKIISNNDYSRWRKGEKIERRKNENRIGDIKEKMPQLNGFANINFVMMVVFVAIGSFYLYSMNGSAMQGYKIKEIEKEIESLRGESEKLQIREAELNSLYRLEEEGRGLDMQEVDDIIYLNGDKSVAIR